MTEIERANGHAATDVLYRLHPAMRDAVLPRLDELPYDVGGIEASLVGIQAKVPADAFTAQLLGTTRAGTGIVINDKGLVLTIGYAILEATEVILATPDGDVIEARVTGYDYESGFGLVSALEPLDQPVLELGDSSGTGERDPVLIAAFGGLEHMSTGLLVSRREFAGYWEYLLDEALFTSPPHGAWSGAALVDANGRLIGVGSLYVEDAIPGSTPLPGNMFIPIELFSSVFGSPAAGHRIRRRSRPWLGMFTAEADGNLVIVGVLPSGPAARAGLKAGDIVLRVCDSPLASLADMYRKTWSLGEAGADVPMTLRREADTFDVVVASGNRYDHLKLPFDH